MDVNVEIDNLVLYGLVDAAGLAERIEAAAGGALTADAAAQAGQAVFDSTIPSAQGHR